MLKTWALFYYNKALFFEPVNKVKGKMVTIQ